jgi:hypothetical protein
MTRVEVLSSKDLAYKINKRDHNPPHVHVEGLGASIRINLLTLEFMDTETGFSASTLRKILEVVRENKLLLLDEWEKKHGKD